jgi:hypothetical protein
MAVTATVVAQGIPNSAWTVIATLDADTGPTVVTHNFNMLGYFVILTPLSDPGVIAKWFVAAQAATTVSITKANVVGSGAVAAQLLLQIIPYNIGQLVPGR